MFNATGLNFGNFGLKRYTMKTIVCILLLASPLAALNAQSIIGKWQLVKETNCMEDQVANAGDTELEMVTEMKSRAGATPSVVTFGEKMEGEESTRMLTRKRPTNKSKFLYKFNGEALWILDKRSQTITDSFIVDKCSADSLILSSSQRPCEVRFFVRLK